MLDNLELLNKIDSRVLSKLVTLFNNIEDIAYIDNTLYVKFRGSMSAYIRFVVDDPKERELAQYRRPTPSLFPDIAQEYKDLLF